MGIGVIILGKSGSGKSTSLRNLDQKETLLIRAVKKALPFRHDWRMWDSETKTGTIVDTDNSSAIETILSRCPEYGKKVIIIDDMQYIMANEFMRRHKEKGYEKFSEMGFKIWSLIHKINELPDDTTVYFLWHTEETEGGVKAKTIGKMLDDKISIEGLFSIVLLASGGDGSYTFRTQTTGADTAKSPIGMFDKLTIENDLKVVDKSIREYYNLGEKR